MTLRRRSKVVLGLLLVVILVVIGRVVITNRPGPSVPANIQRAVTYHVSYPSILPRGWAVDTQTIKMNDGIVFYTVTNGKQSLTVSVQQKPAEFDFNAFYKQGLQQASSFSSPVGQGAIGKSGNYTVGSILINDSWSLVQSTSTSSETIRSVLESLR